MKFLIFIHNSSRKKKKEDISHEKWLSSETILFWLETDSLYTLLVLCFRDMDRQQGSNIWTLYVALLS